MIPVRHPPPPSKKNTSHARQLCCSWEGGPVPRPPSPHPVPLMSRTLSSSVASTSAGPAEGWRTGCLRSLGTSGEQDWFCWPEGTMEVAGLSRRSPSPRAACPAGTLPSWRRQEGRPGAWQTGCAQQHPTGSSDRLARKEKAGWDTVTWSDHARLLRPPTICPARSQ